VSLSLLSQITRQITRFSPRKRIKNAPQYITKGNIFDLQELFNEVNTLYFKGKIKVALTWFERPGEGSFASLIYGKYYEHLHLIKVNKILDDNEVPRYFVAYVLYHEMLHHILPPKINSKGVREVHHKHFKEKEAQFKEYLLAKAWEKEFRRKFFAQYN
jgi:hypothetical protein